MLRGNFGSTRSASQLTILEWPLLMGIRNFPFVEIKVDKKFVAGCADDRLKGTVCRRIIDLADGYGKIDDPAANRPLQPIIGAARNKFFVYLDLDKGKVPNAHEQRPLQDRQLRRRSCGTEVASQHPLPNPGF